MATNSYENNRLGAGYNNLPPIPNLWNAASSSSASGTTVGGYTNTLPTQSVSGLTDGTSSTQGLLSPTNTLIPYQDSDTLAGVVDPTGAYDDEGVTGTSTGTASGSTYVFDTFTTDVETGLATGIELIESYWWLLAIGALAYWYTHRHKG